MGCTMVDFNSLILSEKRILLRKIIKKIVGYYSKLHVLLENKEVEVFSKKINQNEQTLLEKLEQKVSGNLNSIQVFDIALNFISENAA